MKALLTLMVLVSLFTFSLQAQIDFSTTISRSLGSTAISSVAIGDVNNDGRNDAVVATTFYFDPEHDFSIFVFLQNPDGSISQPTRYPYGSSDIKTIVQVVDVNNDKLDDVLYVYGDSLGIRYQETSGILGPAHNFYSGHSADGMKTGDLNNDGLKDIAICHWNDPFIKVFYQQSAGGFQTVSYPLPSAGRDELDVNDMNGDGLDDIIYMPGQLGGPSLYIYYQDKLKGIPEKAAEYSFLHKSYFRFNGIATGDINNDGRNDLVCTMGGNEAWLALIYQNEDGTLQDPTYLDSYDIPTPVEIADLNCDGKNEIIVGHYGWGSFSVWEQDIVGKYSGFKLFKSLSYVGPYSLAIGDLNSDSRQDVLTTDGSSNANFVYNISAPEGTFPTNKIVQFDGKFVDTAYTYQMSQLVYGISKIGECLLNVQYNITDYTFNAHKEGTGDTLLIRNYFMCGNNQTDTLRKHFEINTYSTVYHTDSTILSADTLKENIVVVNTFSSYDTLGITPHHFIDTLVNLSYKFTPEAVYMYVDSLQIESYLLEIAYLETRRAVLDGLICGFNHRDTVTQVYSKVDQLILKSDTTILSKTLVVSYLLGFSETEKMSSIHLYPNPAKDFCTLEVAGLSSFEDTYTVQLISMKGQTVWKKEINAQTELHTLIDGTKLPHGMYTVFIKGKNYIRAGKIIFGN